MHRALQRSLGVLVCLVLAFAATAPAHAHDSLVSSMPEAGTTLDSPPSEVTLTFSATIGEEFAQVAVVGPDGTAYQSGDPVVKGPTVTQAVDALPAGQDLTISYRIVSSDGHPIGGTVPFTIAESAAADVADGTATQPDESAGRTAAGTVTSESVGAGQDDAAATDETQATAETTDDAFPVTWVIGAVAVAAIGGVGVLLTRRSSRRATEQRVSTDA